MKYSVRDINMFQKVSCMEQKSVVFSAKKTEVKNITWNHANWLLWVSSIR